MFLLTSATQPMGLCNCTVESQRTRYVKAGHVPMKNLTSKSNCCNVLQSVACTLYILYLCSMPTRLVGRTWCFSIAVPAAPMSHRPANSQAVSKGPLKAVHIWYGYVWMYPSKIL